MPKSSKISQLRIFLLFSTILCCLPLFEFDFEPQNHNTNLNVYGDNVSSLYKENVIVLHYVR